MSVIDVGPSDAKIMLIGEAPGEEEAEQGIPFVGPAGRLLKQMLSHCGVDYNSCYVTNVMDTRPPGNRFDYFYQGRNQPSPALEAGWSKLMDKVERLKPEVVIPLGNEPLKALCNKSGISSWRGTWLKFRDINVLPTYHPSYISRVYEDHPIFEMDVVKAVTRKPADPPHIILQPSIKQVVEWVDSATRWAERISFDIETVGREVRCLGFSARFSDNQSTLVIPFIKFASSGLVSVKPGDRIVSVGQSNGGNSSGSYWSPSTEVQVVDLIDKLLQSGRPVVGQNSISFDAPLLKQSHALVIKNHYMDTMHAWHCLYSEFPMSLNFLCSIYTDYHAYWNYHDTDDDLSEWRYNGYDCTVTLDVSYKIEEEARSTIV